MALTKKNVLDFFSLLEEDDKENYIELLSLVEAYPNLLNIDRIKNDFDVDIFTHPLKIAINKHKYNVAILFLQLGQNPNLSYLDETGEFIIPILFDIINNILEFIEKESFQATHDCCKLIAIMEAKGLNYDLQKQHVVCEKYEISCLEHCLRVVSNNYAKQHKIYIAYDENNMPKFTLGQAFRNIQKEKYYGYLIKHLLLKIDEAFVQKIDANNYIKNSQFLNDTDVFIHDFAIEICNQYIKEIFNYQIKNFETLNMNINTINYIPLFKLVRD